MPIRQKWRLSFFFLVSYGIRIVSFFSPLLSFEAGAVAQQATQARRRSLAARRPVPEVRQPPLHGAKIQGYVFLLFPGSGAGPPMPAVPEHCQNFPAKAVLEAPILGISD